MEEKRNCLQGVETNQKRVYPCPRSNLMDKSVIETRYFGKRTDIVGTYDYIVRVNGDGCFITDEVNDWEKDEDYRDEAVSNTHLYDRLPIETAKKVLSSWKREL